MGRCHEAPEGIRKSAIDIINQKPNRQSLSLPMAASSLCTREPRGDSFLAYGSEDIGRRFPKKVGEADERGQCTKVPGGRGFFCVVGEQILLIFDSLTKNRGGGEGKIGKLPKKF